MSNIQAVKIIWREIFIDLIKGEKHINISFFRDTIVGKNTFCDEKILLIETAFTSCSR